MPRSSKIGRKKGTHKKLQDESLNQRMSASVKLDRMQGGQTENEKNENDEPIADAPITEKFSKLKIIDLSAPRKRSQQHNQIQLSRKEKKKLHKLKSSAYVQANNSRHSTKSQVSLSVHSVISEINEMHYLMKLRKSFRESDCNLTNLSEGLFATLENEHEAEESAESDDVSEFDSSEYIGLPRDKIEEIRAGFRKSSIFLERRSSAPKADFFDVLGEIPSIDNISLDITEASDDEIPVQISTKSVGDTGKFVDPLTGGDIESSSSETATDIHTHPEISVHSIEHEESTVDLLEEITMDDDEDLGEAFRTEGDEDKDKEGDREHFEGFGLWFSTPKSKMTIAEEFTQATYDDYIQKLEKTVYELLCQLISNVVHAIEYGDPGKLICKNLNKLKLMDELDDKFKKLEAERKRNLHLNKGVIEFLYRKGDFRPLTPDQPEKIKQLIDKHKEIQDKLYAVLYREEELKNFSSIRLSNLRENIEDAKRVASQSHDNCDEMIKKAFHREHFQCLNDVVSRSLKQMSTTRDEISKHRCTLLLRLHTLGELKEKAEKLENLGSGLSMRNFEVLQAATTNLGTKVDEREQELNQLHIRRNKKLHVMTHLMESHIMMQNIVEVKENCLNDLLEERDRARSEVNLQKLIRKGIREETKELQSQSGLAGKTALLLDYDKTVKDLEEIRARVSKLKQRYIQLEAHSNRLEERCNRGSSI